MKSWKNLLDLVAKVGHPYVMSKTILLLIVLAVVGFAGAAGSAIYGVSTYNQASRIHNLYDSKLLDNNSEFDNMWKTISQVAQIPAAKKDGLREIFEGYASARTGNGDNGSLMKWVQESIPNPDLSEYKDVMNIIVGKRDSWTNRQKELVDIARQYNEMLSVFPSNVFLGAFGMHKIDAKIVTSSRTDNVFKTGKDDDTDLGFSKKK